MRRRITTCVIAIIAIISLFIGPAVLLQSATRSNQFGVDLFSELSRKDSNNLIFSPFSVSVSLSMVYQGSAGNTSEQLKSIIGQQFVEANSSGLLQDSSKEVGNYQLDTANALLSSASVLESYKNKLVSQFGAELFELKEPKLNQKLINEWCANKTNGKIKELLSEPPPPDTVVALLNAIYFKGKWKTPFDVLNTKQRTFHGVDNKTAQVPFMRQRGYFNVAHLTKINSTMIELPYQGDDVSFYAVLPDDARTPSDSDIKQLPESLDYFMANNKSKIAIVTIPKFKLKSEFGLIDSVSKLGITDIFSSNAMLPGITGSSSLSVTQMKQVATIDVNEEGSEAAAATYIGMTRSSRPQAFEYTFDRPFLFMIYPRTSQHILFVGRINQF